MPTVRAETRDTRQNAEDTDDRSETVDRSIEHSDNSHAPANSDQLTVNVNNRIKHTVTESDANNVNVDYAGNGIPFKDVKNDNTTWINDDNGESGSIQEKRYKDSSEALELAILQLGPFGFYQRYVVFLLVIPNLLAAMYSLNYVFVADQVPFR